MLRYKGKNYFVNGREVAGPSFRPIWRDLLKAYIPLYGLYFLDKEGEGIPTERWSSIAQVYQLIIIFMIIFALGLKLG